MMLCHQVWLFSSSHPTPSPGATDRLVKAIRSAPRRHNHTIEAPPNWKGNADKRVFYMPWAPTCDMMFPARRSQIGSNPASQRSLRWILGRTNRWEWWRKVLLGPWNTIEEGRASREGPPQPWPGHIKGMVKVIRVHPLGRGTPRPHHCTTGWIEFWKYKCIFKTWIGQLLTMPAVTMATCDPWADFNYCTVPSPQTLTVRFNDI